MLIFVDLSGSIPSSSVLASYHGTHGHPPHVSVSQWLNTRSFPVHGNCVYASRNSIIIYSNGQSVNTSQLTAVTFCVIDILAYSSNTNSMSCTLLVVRIQMYPVFLFQTFWISSLNIVHDRFSWIASFIFLRKMLCIMILASSLFRRFQRSSINEIWNTLMDLWCDTWTWIDEGAYLRNELLE